MYGAYGQLLGDVLHGIYDLDLSPRRSLLATALAAFRGSPLKATAVARDLVAGVRAL
jgi:electron transfer flavoprotein-quinone oxidoreductase